MAVEIITREDLQQFRRQLLDDLKAWTLQLPKPPQESMEGLRTKQVREILHCSVGKLHLLRVAGKLHIKKVGGTVYYRKEEVKKLIEEGF